VISPTQRSLPDNKQQHTTNNNTKQTTTHNKQQHKTNNNTKQTTTHNKQQHTTNNNTQQTQEKNIHASGVTRARNRSKREAGNPRLSQRSHRDRLFIRP